MAGAGISEGMNGGGGPGEGVGRGVPPGITGTNNDSAWGVDARAGEGVGVDPTTSGNSLVAVGVPRVSAWELPTAAPSATTLAVNMEMERNLR